jgi:inorganic pyrophosphatase
VITILIMNKRPTFFLCLSMLFIAVSCDRFKSEKASDPSNKNVVFDESSPNLLSGITPLFENGDVNAVIEIPSGTLEKWELNKSTGKVEWELADNKPRIINYLGYPGNYGMIPRTLLSKENGGDGDPLDVLVLGHPVERGSILKCKIIGVLYLMDRGEQDDKLIAVSANSPLYEVNSISELNKNYNGITAIIQLWFTNYKGPGKMESRGFGERNNATEILITAIHDYEARETKHNNQ